MFICLYEVSLVVILPPRGCVCNFQTRPIFEFSFFSHTCMSQRQISVFSRFFYAEILAMFVVFT